MSRGCSLSRLRALLRSLHSHIIPFRLVLIGSAPRLLAPALKRQARSPTLGPSLLRPSTSLLSKAPVDPVTWNADHSLLTATPLALANGQREPIGQGSPPLTISQHTPTARRAKCRRHRGPRSTRNWPWGLSHSHRGPPCHASTQPRWPSLVPLSPSGLALQWLFAGQEVLPPAGSFLPLTLGFKIPPRGPPLHVPSEVPPGHSLPSGFEVPATLVFLSSAWVSGLTLPRL